MGARIRTAAGISRNGAKAYRTDRTVPGIRAPASAAFDSSRYAGSSSAKNGAEILFRQPLIPGVSDSDANIEGISAFIRSLDRSDLALQLMPYHRMGLSKYAALDKPYELEEIQVMKAEEVEAVRRKYEELGVSCTVSK